MDRGVGKRKVLAPRSNDDYVDLNHVLNPGKRRGKRHDEGSADEAVSEGPYLHADAANSAVFSGSPDITQQHYHHHIVGLSVAGESDLLHHVGQLDVPQLSNGGLAGVHHQHLMGGAGGRQHQPQQQHHPGELPSPASSPSPKQHLGPSGALSEHPSSHLEDDEQAAAALAHHAEQQAELEQQMQLAAALAGHQILPGTFGTVSQVVPLQDNTHARRLMALGRKYADINAQALDTLLEAARQQNNTMTIFIQMTQLTADLAASAADLLPEGIPAEGCEAAPLEVPRTALVHHLREYICRTSGHYIHPAMQVLRHPLTGEELQGVRQLSSYGLGDGAVITLELAAANQDAYHQCIGLEGGYTAALTAMPDGQQRQPVAPRKKFTAEEMRALTEGVRLFGYSWSTIKSHFSEVLKERTQVNLKDKWRNLSKGANTQWKDERAPLPPDLKDMVRAVVASHPPSTATPRSGLQASSALAAAQAATVAGLVGAQPRAMLMAPGGEDCLAGGVPPGLAMHQLDGGLAAALQQHGMMPVDCSAGGVAGQGMGRHLTLEGLDLAHLGGDVSAVLEASAAAAMSAAESVQHDLSPAACAAVAAAHHASQMAVVYGLDQH